jgi:hypothetical protein
MSALISAVAIVMGASLPIFGLALYSRSRLRRDAARLEKHRMRPIRTQAEREPVSTGSLAWLSATIGRPPYSPPRSTTPFVRPCPHCRYQASEPSVFCRRCGTRLIG